VPAAGGEGLRLGAGDAVGGPGNELCGDLDAGPVGDEDLGLVGIAVVPGELRRPLGLSRALVHPADYRGARIGIRPAGVADATFDALRADAEGFPATPEGLVGFDGSLNTGLTLRTIRVVDEVAEVRAGATLLYDSDPEAEEEETHVKASALLDAIRRPSGVEVEAPRGFDANTGVGRRILLVDHQDSFVHTLANYLRQTGAEVVTWRSGFPPADLDALRPDLVVLSPGPGCPADFDVSGALAAPRERHLAQPGAWGAARMGLSAARGPTPAGRADRVPVGRGGGVGFVIERRQRKHGAEHLAVRDRIAARYGPEQGRLHEVAVLRASLGDAALGDDGYPVVHRLRDHRLDAPVLLCVE